MFPMIKSVDCLFLSHQMPPEIPVSRKITYPRLTFQINLHGIPACSSDLSRTITTESPTFEKCWMVGLKLYNHLFFGSSDRFVEQFSEFPSFVVKW